MRYCLNGSKDWEGAHRFGDTIYPLRQILVLLTWTQGSAERFQDGSPRLHPTTAAKIGVATSGCRENERSDAHTGCSEVGPGRPSRRESRWPCDATCGSSAHGTLDKESTYRQTPESSSVQQRRRPRRLAKPCSDAWTGPIRPDTSGSTSLPRRVPMMLPRTGNNNCASRFQVNFR